VSATFAAAFVALYVGHQLADHGAQSDRQANGKVGKGWPAARAMAAHVGTHGALQTLLLCALIPLGVAVSPAGLAAGVSWSMATHAFIDRRWPVLWLLHHTGSSGFATLDGRPVNGPYLTDQAIHVVCLFVAAWLIGALS
jgi:hypothetical protein